VNSEIWHLNANMAKTEQRATAQRNYLSKELEDENDSVQQSQNIVKGFVSYCRRLPSWCGVHGSAALRMTAIGRVS
jgi:hypothetical protein